MLTPAACLTAFRAALALAAPAVVLRILGVAPGPAGALAHVAAFYALAMLAFGAAPRVRRNDLALVVAALACAAEALHALRLGHVATPELAADLAGVAAAWAPVPLEALRRLGREAPRTPLGEVVMRDRRRRRSGSLRRA